LQCALEILSKNSIDRAVFCDAIIKLLVMGRGKGRNIYKWSSKLRSNYFWQRL